MSPIPTDRPALQLLQEALTYLAQGNPRSALAPATQATALDDTLAVAPHILAKAYAQLGETTSAIAAYKKAAARYLAIPDPSHARHCVEAIESLQTLAIPTSTIPTSAPLQPIPLDPAIAQQFLEQATLRLDQGDYANALQDVQWLLQLEPHHPKALCVFALLQAKMGHPGVATGAIARALTQDPKNPELRFHRGLVRLALNDGWGAIEEFSDLLAHDATNPALYLQRGQAYVLLHDFDNAFKDVSNAIGIAPDNPEAYALRAIIYQKTEDLKAALQDYQTAAAQWLNQGKWTHQQKMQEQVAIVEGLIHRQKTQHDQGVRVPIKYLVSGVPVIEVRFNGQYTFDMMLDTGASTTLISGKMAGILGVETIGYSWGNMADGRNVRMAVGQMGSIGVGQTETGTVYDLQVSIFEGEIDGLLGQNFLTHYNLRMFADAIEFHRK